VVIGGVVVAHNRQVGLFVRSGGSGLDAGRGKAWGASLLISILSVVVVAFAGSVASASAAPTSVRSVVNAYWTITDGCVVTTVSLGSTQTNPDPPTTSFYLSQQQNCEDPSSVRPVLTLEGAGFTGGQLQVNSGLTKARFIATIPVTCYPYEVGACGQELYKTDSVSLDLSWTSKAKTEGFTTDDDSTCKARYGTATGSILLGGDLNYLAADGGTLLADRTETNIQRCIS
jgi:hypothetical protein